MGCCVIQWVGHSRQEAKMAEVKPILGVIGGTGLAQIAGLVRPEQIEAKTPFGSPSGPLTVGYLRGMRVVFLARHGAGHMFQPRDIPYQANVWAMRQLGVTHLVSLSAVGSLLEGLPPGRLVIVDDFFDRTNELPRTFFGEPGLVVHVSFGDPTCNELRPQLFSAARQAGLGEETIHGGTYVCIPGPRFSTHAESRFFQTTVPGAAVVGMTALREASLAREAEMHYACLALVTDYDAWREGEGSVTGEMVQRTIRENAGRAEAVIAELAHILSHDSPRVWACGCADALANGAIHTAPEHIPPELCDRYKLLIAHRLPHPAN